MREPASETADRQDAVAAYDYTLPDDLIAQEPAAGRADARLLVVDRAADALTHAHVRDLPALLRPGDLLVVNNTRVIPARVRGVRAGSGGRVELLLLEPAGADDRWLALGRASRRIRPGAVFELADGRLRATVEAAGEDGQLTVRLACDGPLADILEAAGEMPLPPYIRRGPGAGRCATDRERYQTVYARHPGAVAAPTAGLHFTPALFEALAARGIGRAEITLHVGIGTFRPVTAEHVGEHRMEAERYRVDTDAAEAIAETRRRGGRIVAVGSTSVRTLETVAADDGTVSAGEGRSSLFIHPPYEFRVTDAMLTNFHLPRSTLLMMVSALAGRDLIMRAYREAVRSRYRFYSYGDAMLIV